MRSESVRLLPEALAELQQLLAAHRVPYKCAVPAARYTTFLIGESFSLLIEPESCEQIQDAVRAIRSLELNPLYLGGGSNLLLPDRELERPVLKPGRALRSTQALGGGRFEVACAMPLMSLSRDLCDQGWSGLEFAGGIPALLGGAVRMNAGAHGGQMADILESIQFIDSSGALQTIAAQELSFSYRRVNLPVDAFVVSAVIKLEQGDPQNTRAIRKKNLDHRKKYQPLSLPSAGSVFKNPDPEYTAGRVLEECGMKGAQVGGACVSEMHANWIVNTQRTARASDVITLIERCITQAQAQKGMQLEPELVVVG